MGSMPADCFQEKNPPTILHRPSWQVFIFFDHLLPCVDIFYLINVDKKSIFLDYLIFFFNSINVGPLTLFLCCHVTLIYGLIPPMASRNGVNKVAGSGKKKSKLINIRPMFIRDYRDWFFLCVKNWKYVKKIWIIKFIRPVRKIGTLEYPFIDFECST